MLLVATSAPAASVAQQLNAIYQPLRVEQAALAPDGRHVAFVVREGRGLEVQIFDLERAGAKVRVPFEERSTARVSLFEWAAADLLVAMSDGPIVLATDPAGKAPRILLTAQTFASSPQMGRLVVRALGIPPDAAGGLMLEEARTFEGEMVLDLIRLDLRTGERRVVHTKDIDPPGGSLLIDRQGRPRVLFSRNELPQRFSYLPEGGKAGDWTPLDRMFKGETSFAFHVTPRNFTGRRAIPLGFDTDPNVLYFAANTDRDTFGLYALDLRTGKRGELAIEEADFDLAELNAPFTEPMLVFDRARHTLAGVRVDGLEARTRWLDADLARVQATLGEKFSRRHVRIVDWDAARARFLVLVAEDSDPGRYFVFHREGARCVEYFRRAALNPDEANRVETVAFDLAGGGRLTGYITRPHRPPVAKPALVVWFHDGPWQRVSSGFHADAQALAAMGFMVVEFNYRGSAGFGLRHREAITAGFDRVPVEDAVAGITRMAEKYAFDRRRVAVGGEGFGGYLALRALQLHPDTFRCGVAINAPLDLGQLQRSERAEAQRRRMIESEVQAGFQRRLNAPAGGEEQDASGGAASEQAMAQMVAPGEPVDFEREHARSFFGPSSAARVAVDAHPELLMRPVFFLHDPRNQKATIGPVKDLTEVLIRRKRSPQLKELSPPFARGVPAARAAVFRSVGEFLNTNLYDFGVKIGDVTEKEEKP
jgi:poly(3-hydroxybutyrate) depolymerase